MKNTFTSIIISLGLSLFLFLPLAPAAADQNDARLDELFKKLQETTDLLELRSTETEIWNIWTDSGRADVNALMDEGLESMQARNYDMALEKFDEIVELAPDFAEGWNKRATVYYLMHQLNESMQDVQRTLKLEPRHFGALSGIGLIFMEIGDEAGAIQAFEEVLKVHPYSPGTRENIKRLRSNLRDSMI
jgi:tetratricopeptide (TPR) repeat protein